MGNRNMHRARRNQRDEFYTQLRDIESELKHYTKHFKGKVVYMNCDNPEESKFWEYFKGNFKRLGLKKIIATYYQIGKPTYKTEFDGVKEEKTLLKQNGDFRGVESVNVLKESDIVVTNPPFSLFREYIGQLKEYKKDFIIVSNNNALTYRDVFGMIKGEEMWLGHNANKSMEFMLPKDYEKYERVDEEGNKYGKVPSISWFTTLNIPKREEWLKTGKEFKKEEYEVYDNFDAVNVGRVVDIPDDYCGVMGVPITFLTRHNIEQFKIVGLGTSRKHYKPNKKYGRMQTVNPDGSVKEGAPILSTLAIRVEEAPKGKAYYIDEFGNYYIQPYARLLIQRK